MAGAQVTEINCKTLLNRLNALRPPARLAACSILDVPFFPFRWTLNPYVPFFPFRWTGVPPRL